MLPVKQLGPLLRSLSAPSALSALPALSSSLAGVRYSSSAFPTPGPGASGTGTPPLTKKALAHAKKAANAALLKTQTNAAAGPLEMNQTIYGRFRRLLPTARIKRSNNELRRAARELIASGLKSGKFTPGSTPTFQELYYTALPLKSGPADAFKRAFSDFMHIVAINNASKSSQASVYRISKFLVRDTNYDLSVARNIEALAFSKTVYNGEAAVIRQGKPGTPQWAKNKHLHMEHGNSVRNIIYEGSAIYGYLMDQGFDQTVIDTVMFDMTEQNIDIASNPLVCNPRTSVDNSVAGIVDNGVFQGFSVAEAAKDAYDKAVKTKGFDALHTKESFLENKGLAQTVGELYDTPDKYVKAIENYVIHNNTFVLEQWKAYKDKIPSLNVSSMTPEQAGQYKSASTMMCEQQIKFYSGIINKPVVIGGGTYKDKDGYLHTDNSIASNLSENYKTLLNGVFAATIINTIKPIDEDDPKFENSAPINIREFHKENMAFLKQAYTFFLSYFKTHNFAEIVLKEDPLSYKSYKQLGKSNEQFLNNTLNEVFDIKQEELDGGTRKHHKHHKQHNKTHKHHKHSNKTKKHRKIRKYTLKRK
jgi:hypothetical protein